MGGETQINKIRIEKGKVATDNAEMQRIIRDDSKQWYVSHVDNLEEIDKFLDNYNIPWPSQEEIENINR